MQLSQTMKLKELELIAKKNEFCITKRKPQ